MLTLFHQVLQTEAYQDIKRSSNDRGPITPDIKKCPADVSGQNNAPKKSDDYNGLSSVLKSSNVQLDSEKMHDIKSSGNDHSEICDSCEEHWDGDVVFIDDIFVEMCEGNSTINTELQIKDYFNILRVLFTIKEKMEVNTQLREDTLEEKGRNGLADEIKENAENNSNGQTEETEAGKENTSSEINQTDNIDEVDKNKEDEQKNVTSNNDANDHLQRLQSASSSQRNCFTSVKAVRNVLQEGTVSSEKENYKLSLLREK